MHAVFGAFLFGACLPRDDRLLAALIERIEYVAILVLMPVFFALAGLNTTPDAFVGAGLGALAADSRRRHRRQDRRRCGRCAHRRPAVARCRFAIGSLMNARGLMELIVIKIGPRHRPHRPGAVHHADGDGARDDADDRPAADAVRGGANPPSRASKPSCRSGFSPAPLTTPRPPAFGEQLGSVRDPEAEYCKLRRVACRQHGFDAQSAGRSSM